MPVVGFGAADYGSTPTMAMLADRKTGRESITAKLVANLITEAGANRVLAMDLLAQIQGYFDIPFDHVYGSPVLLDTWRINNCLILLLFHRMSAAWQGLGLCEKLDDAPLAIIDKRRQAHNVAEVLNDRRR